MEFSEEDDYLLPTQALPVIAEDFSVYEAVDGGNLSEATTYLSAVRREAQNLPSVVTATISQLPAGVSVNSSRPSMVSLYETGNGCRLGELPIAVCTSESPLSQARPSPCESFETLRYALNELSPTSADIEEINYRQSFSSINLPLSGDTDIWMNDTLRRFRRLKCKLAADWERSSSSGHHWLCTEQQWLQLYKEKIPTADFLSKADSVLVCSALEYLADFLESNSLQCNTHVMFWLFSLLVYLDELKAMDSDVAWTLQKLRRFLEKALPGCMLLQDFERLVPAVRAVVGIIHLHFKQK
ncbi:hypothetical protein IE077_003033 [Cardiosporidium cionae]|uniref:Gem-associated protein 2 n=1 Tax=Cardiosporidium cionae TaxID=476202 RepID=A0ABQ7J9A2_9APIC|nr:hypothetical protein IE077_003033 [Cardiosporidium cionae]|eukprot:KAF8820562.1 hypothetical protein IE077_003033 [Cardiosporidium cionae]